MTEPQKQIPKWQNQEITDAEREKVLAFLNTLKAPKAKQDLPFIWELKKDGVVSYAIGTHHACPLDFTEQLKPFASYAHKLLFEYAEQPSPSFFAALSEIRSGPFIDMLTQEQRDKFNLLFAPLDVTHARDLPISHLYRENMSRFGLPPKLFGIDTLLIHLGTEVNISCHSLEKEEECLGYLLDTMKRYYCKFGKILEVEDAQFSIGRSQFQQLTDAYLSGDGDKVMNVKDYLTDISVGDIMKGNKIIYADRNRKMVARSLSYFSQPTVIAVGVTHLLGPESMLIDYVTNGIEVERVKENPFKNENP